MKNDPRPRLARQLLTLPNILTLSRLALIPFFLVASLQSRHLLAFSLFLLAAVTDAFDGYIARRYDLRSRLGAILDPAADKLMMTCGYVAYSFSAVAFHHLPLWLTFFVFLRDVAMVLAAYLIYKRTGVKQFDPTALGKISTITQVVALAVTIAANTMLAPLALLLLLPTQVVALLLTLVSGWDYARGWLIRLRQYETDLREAGAEPRDRDFSSH